MDIPPESLEDFLASLPASPDEAVVSGRPNFDASTTTCSFDLSLEEDIAPRTKIKSAMSYSSSSKDVSSSSFRHRRAPRSLKSSSYNNKTKRLSRAITNAMDRSKSTNDASDANNLPVPKETEKVSSLGKDINLELDITNPSKRNAEDNVAQIEEGIQFLEQTAILQRPTIHPLQKHDQEAEPEEPQYARSNTQHYPSQHQDASQHQIEQLQKELDATTQTTEELEVLLAEEQTKNEVLRLRVTRAENVNRAQQALNHEMAIRIKIQGRANAALKTTNGGVASKARAVTASAMAAAAMVASQVQYLSHKLLVNKLYPASMTTAAPKDSADNNKTSNRQNDTHNPALDQGDNLKTEKEAAYNPLIARSFMTLSITSKAEDTASRLAILFRRVKVQTF